MKTLKALIREAGHTQQSLASASGVSRSNINQYCNAHHRPNDETKAKIAKALEIDEWTLHEVLKHMWKEKEEGRDEPRKRRLTVLCTTKEYRLISEKGARELALALLGE